MKKITFVGFIPKNIESDKVRYHCRLKGFFRGPAHSICIINISQKQIKFIQIVFHSFSKNDCHMLFEKVS